MRYPNALSVTRYLKYFFVALFTLGMAPGFGASAAEYPEKAIRFVVPFEPGGNSDVIARVVAERMAAKLGQPVVIENVTGAGGAIGTGQVAESEPDGYTLLLANSAPLALALAMGDQISYDPLNDFAYVSLMVRSPYMVVVNKNSGITTLDQLIEQARSKPDEISYGTSGVGTNTHFLGEMLASESKVELLHVPYRGGGSYMTALLSGEVSMAFATVPTYSPHTGTVNALAITSAQRNNSVPDVPTVRELGYPGVEGGVWLGVAAPAGTPAEIVAKLNQTIAEILANDETASRLRTLGAEPEPSTPEAFRALVTNDIEKFTTIAKAANINP